MKEWATTAKLPSKSLNKRLWWICLYWMPIRYETKCYVAKQNESASRIIIKHINFSRRSCPHLQDFLYFCNRGICLLFGNILGQTIIINKWTIASLAMVVRQSMGLTTAKRIQNLDCSLYSTKKREKSNFRVSKNSYIETYSPTQDGNQAMKR